MQSCSYTTILFLSYLRGMETLLSLVWKHKHSPVLILPTRNGNIISSKSGFASSGNSVLILPTRNGNQLKLRLRRATNSGSYPTYEEWKLGFVNVIEQLTKVLILPTRNGNYPSYAPKFAARMFLSYLRGMET